MQKTRRHVDRMMTSPHVPVVNVKYAQKHKRYEITLSTYVSVFQPGFRGTQGFRERLPRVPQLTCSKMTLLAKSRQTMSLKCSASIFFCLKLRFYASFYIDSLCWIIFVVSKILTYLHFRLKPIS